MHMSEESVPRFTAPSDSSLIWSSSDLWLLSFWREVVAPDEIVSDSCKNSDK